MQIISPCSQNFNKMYQQGEGRYCSSCEKVVVDFTTMNQNEIQSYFEKHKEKDICGRIKSYQINKQTAFEKFLLSTKEFVFHKINFTPLRLALLAIVSGLMTFTTSCMGKMMPPVKKETSPGKDSIHQERQKTRGKNH